MLSQATPDEIASRQATLRTAFISRVFKQLMRSGARPVKVVGAIGVRSDILQGLKEPGEAVEVAQGRLLAWFAKQYPLIARSGAVDMSR